MEIWKDILNYEGYYEVSNKGNVRSVDRIIVKKNGVSQLRKGRILLPSKDKDGYLYVRLNRDGKQNTFKVHRLVAIAFLPLLNKSYDELEVNHKDLDRSNNVVENLEWVTRLENITHSKKKGTHISCRNRCGYDNPNYGNRKLHEKYFLNKKLSKEKQARSGSQNGRSVSVRFLDQDKNLIAVFPYIRKCAEYLIDCGITKSKRLDAVSNNISKSCKSGNPYSSYYFEYA